jgi:hypothetical protein
VLVTKHRHPLTGTSLAKPANSALTVATCFSRLSISFVRSRPAIFSFGCAACGGRAASEQMAALRERLGEQLLSASVRIPMPLACDQLLLLS